MDFETGPLHHLRAWREYRRLTQEQLAERVGTTKAVISLLERHERSLSDKWARRLAPALNTTAGFLFDHDPADLPTDVLEVWAAIPEAQKEQAMAVLQTFVRGDRTGTKG